jgi:hypothetical protein
MCSGIELRRGRVEINIWEFLLNRDYLESLLTLDVLFFFFLVTVTSG